MKKPFLTLALSIAVAFCFGQAQYVNPFVGTDGHGHTFPGAIVPFGAIQVSPDTRLDSWDGCSGYHYSDNLIYGFSHTHLSGTGCSDYGDILVMPFAGKPSINNQKYASTFSHKNETASPGYYSVKLDNGIFVELTTEQHVAMHRITFPKSSSHGIIVDLTHRDKVLASAIGHEGNEIFGYRRSEAWNPNQYCAFSILASEPIQKIEYYSDNQLVDAKDIRGENCKAVIYFDKKVKNVTLNVAISAVDIPGAKNNQKEISNFNFDQVKSKAVAAWNKELSKIEVESSNEEYLKVFYTALYHCFTSPYLYSDIDGRYRGQDGEIHDGDGSHQMYTVFSLWDTYRALHPLLNIIDRKRTEDFLYTFMQHYRQGGMLPVWELSAHETWCMIGYHSVPVILDAYIKGIHPYDEKEMLKAMVHSATLNKLGRTEFANFGYIPGDADNESVSKTLEYAYDDWCIAQFAKLIGDNKVFHEFYARSQAYRNIMDPNGFMHGKINGGFVQPFDPTEVNNYYTEANSWQYSTYVPHDIPGYIYQMGGEEHVSFFLNQLFTTSSKMTGRDQSDITGIIGQYAHGNEPSHHAVYLFNYVNQYDRTVELARKIMNELYTSKPDGLCGNEDCGQMSAWYVLSSLGFYPVCPGSNTYDLGYPMFNKATIHLENGKDIVIRKTGKGDFVSGVTLNGRAIDNRHAFTFDQIKDGGVLVFTFSDKPSKKKEPKTTLTLSNKIDSKAGKDGASAPVTRSSKIMKATMPYFSTDKKCFSDKDTIQILNYHPNLPKGQKIESFDNAIYYTLDGSTPNKDNGTLYTEPIVIDTDVTVIAVAVNPTGSTSLVTEAHYTKFNKDKNLTYVTKPTPQYYAGGDNGLIDGIRGKANWRVGSWQGFSDNFEAVIDLQKVKPVTNVTISCLEDVRAWIFFPRKLTVYISNDGKNYQPFGSIDGIESVKDENAKLHEFIVEGNLSGRYLKIVVESYGKLPLWHVSAGQQSWLFIDEIIVK
ncbi:MAG: GH92 family glycosyl hydrolase [Bacteroidales bacterium]|nr:GH92 family glycosyl hydrolase [Bacteroidales bacterium]